ncbi:uncharacterized protein [Onthophagus taurus]|uniref:uncharacterized protein n=1 Tax=Onthophagus taurus TaxID=166361 RepID=UPI000C201A12|nr:uncharacterized protein LOC111429170 [Onthophagus taurus]
MGLIYVFLLIFLTSTANSSSNYSPESDNSLENYEDNNLFIDLLSYAATLSDTDLDKFLNEDDTDDIFSLNIVKSRAKRELPEWARILIKCTVKIFFPDSQLLNLITDVEKLFDNNVLDVKVIVDEMSVKYELMEAEKNDGVIQKRSVEGIQSFFEDSCVREAINYGIKNREKIKKAFKKSVEWGKEKIRKLRESKGWKKMKDFFRG